MKARAGLILAIVTTVEVKVELQLWSICQQIYKKKRVKFQQQKSPGAGAPMQLHLERGGPDLYRRGELKGGDKPSKGGDRQLEPCVPPLPPPEKETLGGHSFAAFHFEVPIPKGVFVPFP